MKRFLPLFILCLFALSGNAQIVISEIMYNPPEGGQDSLEYIEIVNTGNAALDISGYYFDPAEGIGDTLPTGTMLGVGEFFVFAKSASAMSNVFGVSVRQWTDGALTNGGEDIVFRDANGDVVDIVEYSDEAPWPGFDDGTDGQGASIELCDLASDNALGSNWRASDTSTGVTLNDRDVRGTPGAANGVSCVVVVDHTIEVSSNVFTPADITINVGETVRWENVGGNHNINGTQATYPDNPESFGNGAASTDLWTYDFTFNQVGVHDYQCDPHVGLGMVGTVTVIDPNAPAYPAYDIATVTSTDADGVADSLFVSCSLTGTVHSPNFRPGGLTFTIIDSNGDGINVFSNSANLGYTVAMGDEVQINGEIGQFNGLTQIVPDEITVLGSNALMDPVPVSDLGESTESQLVVIDGTLDVSQWSGDGSTFNVDMTLTNGSTVVVRVDSDVDPSSLAWDCAEVSVIGIGGQFDGDAPYDSGYQIFPRFNEDIMCVLSNNNLDADGEIKLISNPVQDRLNIDTEVSIDRYRIFDLSGKLIQNGTYSSSIFVDQLMSGMYFLQLSQANRTHTIRFVKQ